MCRHRVKFIVIGAHALAVLGKPRYTGDLDVFIEASEANIKRVSAALRDFGFDVLADEAVTSFAIPGSLLVLGIEPVQINITNAISGVSFKEAWKNKNVRHVASRKVAFLGRDTLIKNKRAASQDPSRGPKRYVDLADIASLEDE